jgi:phospholipase C
MNLLSKSISFLLIFTAATTSAFTNEPSTKTPIKHLIVIFQENRAFDHYFGTYPHAKHKHGKYGFIPRKNTPTVNGLSFPLVKNNQNLAQPFRLSRSEVNTSSPGHKYTVLQQACNSGLMDMFVQTTGSNCVPQKIVMSHFDGNTVTALWNYAQFFSMSDNFHTTHICGSTVGAVNLISGQVHGALPTTLDELDGTPIVRQGTLINDIDPKFDRCSKTPSTVELTGINIGNLLNDKGITWGWFQGGFADCSKTHEGPLGLQVVDYVPHHNPFQFYQSTSNPQHVPPTSPKMVGRTDQANHLYDLSDFWTAAEHGNIPAVSFFKARAFQNGHAFNSNPLFEQEFLVSTINKLQKMPQWENMAIIIAYDDSGGFYDHEMPTIINQSQIPNVDVLVGTNAGTNPPLGGYQGRLSYGYRVPCVVISPWAKQNYVAHNLMDQTSILRFIEDNWDLGRIGNFSFDATAGDLTTLFDFKKRKQRYLILDQKTGKVIHRKI